MLTVRSSPTAVTGKGIVESTTKTKRDRHVPVPEPVWRRLHAELPTDPNALVFPGRKGGFLPLGEYRWAFDNAGDQVGIEGWYRTVWDTPRPRWRSAQALTSSRATAPWTRSSGDDARPARPSAQRRSSGVADALCKVIENTAVSLRYAETEQSRAPGMR